jgi:hypothetical protein
VMRSDDILTVFSTDDGMKKTERIISKARQPEITHKHTTHTKAEIESFLVQQIYIFNVSDFHIYQEKARRKRFMYNRNIRVYIIKTPNQSHPAQHPKPPLMKKKTSSHI